jgi:hypothetical protein
LLHAWGYSYFSVTLYLEQGSKNYNDSTPVFAHFPYFEKIKVGLRDFHPVCMSMLTPFECLNQPL